MGIRDKWWDQITPRIWEELHDKNKNHIMTIVGMPGTGKSYLALGICQTIDPTFTPENIKDRVLYDMADLDVDKLPEKGGAIVFDEIGVTAHHRRHMSINNVFLSKILQVVRHTNTLIVMTTPSDKYIDSDAEDLINTKMMTTYYNDTRNRNYAKVRIMKHNPMMGATWSEAPIVYRPDTGEVVRQNGAIAFHGPTARMKRVYEEWSQKNKENIEKSLRERKEDEESGRMSKKDVIELLLRQGKDVSEVVSELEGTPFETSKGYVRVVKSDANIEIDEDN